MNKKKSSWTHALFAYAGGAKGELGLSVVLSIVSILVGLVPFYCMYRIICLFAAGTAARQALVSWCLGALTAYAGKVVCFTLSTGISHHAAYNILEGLRLRLVERFLHTPLGEVQKHSIGEIKSILVDKIENIEPPLAHMIPEGAGHIVLPLVSLTEMNQANGNPHLTQGQSRLPVVDPKNAAVKSLKAAKRGRAVYTTGAFYKFYRLLAKILPHTFLIKFTGLG